jgi:hypothetical protein
MLRFILWFRAKLAWCWRIGLIKRTTAFHWEMDRALGEFTWKLKE